MSQSLSGKHIFIVEDNISNRVIYQVMMKRHGGTVIFDHWGHESVSLLEQTDKVDLIILDLMLGNGINGFDILQDIRLKPDYSEIPIVAISAADPLVTIPRAQDEGFNGFIAKPINDDLFIDQLQRIMAGEALWYGGSRYGYMS